MAFVYSDGTRKAPLALDQWQVMMNEILIVRYGCVVHYCNPQSYYYLLSLYQALESSDDDLPPLPPPMPTLEELKKISQSGACKVHLHVQIA